MDALNTLRAILTVAAAFAAVLLLTQQRWVPAIVLTVGVAAHTALFLYQQRVRARLEDQFPPHERLST